MDPTIFGLAVWRCATQNQRMISPSNRCKATLGDHDQGSPHSGASQCSPKTAIK